MNGANQKYEVVLLNLCCFMVEEKGYDDVYLKFEGKRIWPENAKKLPISEDTVTNLDVNLGEFVSGDMITIALWDWDLFSPDDHYGNFEIYFEGEEGRYTTDLTLNTRETTKARYRLEWECFPVGSYND